MEQNVNSSGLVFGHFFEIGPHGSADDQIVASVAVEVTCGDGVSEISTDLTTSYVVQIPKLRVVQDHFAQQAVASRHANGHVVVVSVAIELAHGDGITQVRVVVVGRSLGCLVLVSQRLQLLRKHLSLPIPRSDSADEYLVSILKVSRFITTVPPA